MFIFYFLFSLSDWIRPFCGAIGYVLLLFQVHWIRPLAGLSHSHVLVAYLGNLARHPNQSVSRARHDDSTSNLKRHITRCASVPEAEAAGQLTMPILLGAQRTVNRNSASTSSSGVPATIAP